MNDNPHARQPGHSRPVSREEMARRIARFGDLQVDDNAFPDLTDAARERSVQYVISPGQTAGPAPIDAPHNFHMAILTMKPGVRPVPHAHPYNEVFMPLDAGFTFYWGEELTESVRLQPFGVISVPAGVFRTFENVGDRPGHVMALFDIAGDPHRGIVVPPEIYEQYYKDSGWRPTTPDRRD